MRPLRGRRLDDDVVELPIPAAVGKRLVGRPCLEDDAEGLVEPRVGLFHRHTEPSEFIVSVALADAEIEPASGEEIESRRLFGQQDRIMPGQYDHGRSEPQPSGAGAEPGQQVERRGDLPVAGEVMLDDESAVKAERFGLDIVLDKITKSLAAVELGAATPRRRAAEQTELHCFVFPSGEQFTVKIIASAKSLQMRILINGSSQRHKTSH